MNKRDKYIRTTIVYGILCAGAFFILNAVFGRSYAWSLPLYPSISICMAVYCVIMARWTRTGMIKIMFPLILLFAACLLTGSFFSYLLLVMGIFSWVRSGICFKKTSFAALFIEGLLCVGAGLFIFLLFPHNPMSRALGIWMFFLVQTLYYLFFSGRKESEIVGIKRDAFESARFEAEKLLNEL